MWPRVVFKHNNHAVVCVSVGTATRAVSRWPPKVLLPLHHKDHFWPLSALTAPQAPSHPAHLHNTGLYWLVWNPPPQESLLILAALPPSQEDNLLWLPSISHLLSLSLFLFWSLCRFPLHSTQSLHAPLSPEHTHLTLTFFLWFSLQLFFRLEVEVVNREGLISSTASLCVLLYRQSLASCLFTQPDQLGPHSESMREDMRWDRLPPLLTVCRGSSLLQPSSCFSFSRVWLKMLFDAWHWYNSRFWMFLITFGRQDVDCEADWGLESHQQVQLFHRQEQEKRWKSRVWILLKAHRSTQICSYEHLNATILCF